MKLEKGIPMLNHDQHSRYFNIVAIEYHIDQMEKMNLNSPSIFKSIQKQMNSLKRITKGLEPVDLFNELIGLSR